jgi:hypothetical protein
VAHRTPRGKRASWNGNQPLSRATKIAKTAILKNQNIELESSSFYLEIGIF